MFHPPARALAGIAVAGLLLAGCTNDPDAATGTSASGSPTTAAPTGAGSASASPSSTLTAEEQQAFEEATEVVLAYRQTITDLYSGARTNLNDLNQVATGDKVDQDLSHIQRSLGEGWRYEPEGGVVALVSAYPSKVDLAGDPAQVILRACLDTTAITDINPAGARTRGAREEVPGTLVRTTYSPTPGSAVTRVSTDKDDPVDRRC
jgi:hypothetical protein